jgi:hypothetical protein
VMVPCEPCTPPRHAVVHALPLTAIVYRERADAAHSVPHGMTYRFKVPPACASGTFIRVPVPGALPATIETVTVRVPDDFMPGCRLSFVLPCNFAEERARARAAMRLQAAARGRATRQSEEGRRAMAVRQIAAAAKRARQKLVQEDNSRRSISGVTDRLALDALSAQLLWVEREELELLAV